MASTTRSRGPFEMVFEHPDGKVHGVLDSLRYAHVAQEELKKAADQLGERIAGGAGSQPFLSHN